MIRYIDKCKISFIIIFSLVIQLIMPCFTSTVFAQELQDPNSLSVSIKKEIITGTEPFNTTGNATPDFCPPGDDYSVNDSYVRTLDTVGYTIDYWINPAGSVAKDCILTATLTEVNGEPVAIWDTNLENLYPGLTISNEGRTFTYNLGDRDGGTAYSFSPTAKVLGTAANGQTFELEVNFSASNAAAASASSDSITVSAFPKLDLALNCYDTRPALGPFNEMGLLVYSTIEVLIKDGKGSEHVNEDLKFDVDLSQLRSLGLHPRLYDWKKAVAPNGDNETNYITPYGQGGKENGVTNSGDFTATQSAPGEDVKIAISGADLSGNHTPSEYSSGDVISLEDKYVVSGYLVFWIPADEIPVGETEIQISYKNFDPNAVSGQSNFGDGKEPLENNTDTKKILKPSGNADFAYDEYYNDKNGQALPAEEGDIWDYNGVLVAGAEFRTKIRLENRGFIPVTDLIAVSKFDPNLVELVEKSSGIAHAFDWIEGVSNDDILVEYGVGGASGDSGYDDWTEQRDSTGEDSDSTGGWYTNINDAPGPISKIRIRMKDGKAVPAKTYIELKVYMRLKDKPLGTIVPSFLSIKANELNNGQWRHSAYDPENNANRDYKSDRLTVTGALARTSIQSDKNTIRAGDTVKYTIQSTLTADPPGNYGNAQNAKIVEILPAGLTYVESSAKKGDSTFEPLTTKNADGTTTLTWDLGNLPINEAIDDITYDAVSDIDVKNMTSLNNKVVISTSTDVSRELSRTSQKSITISNDRAWGIYKTVDKELVEVGEDLSYTLKYFQLTDKTLKNFDFIEILPYKGDGRRPNTNYTGSYKLKSISGSNEETFLVTDASPESISSDPNIVGGVNWVERGVIPDESVTAIKISAAEFPQNEPTRSINLVLQPSGNRGGDIYTNRFTGRVSEIDALVESNDVCIKVIDRGGSSIGDTLWNDKDEDQVQDLDEEGIANVKVILIDSKGSKVETVTDADGKYIFNNLLSGNYTVTIDSETLPSEMKETFELDGTLDNSVSVTVSQGQAKDDVDFGYVKTKESTEDNNNNDNNDDNKKTASIGDTVWNDKDRNGIQDSDEIGISNVKVILTDKSGIKTITLTDDNGKYAFENLESGDYTVTIDPVTLPEGLEETFEIDRTLDNSVKVSVSEGQVKDDVDFGCAQRVKHNHKNKNKNHDKNENYDKDKNHDKGTDNVKQPSIGDESGNNQKDDTEVDIEDEETPLGTAENEEDIQDEETPLGTAENKVNIENEEIPLSPANIKKNNTSNNAINLPKTGTEDFNLLLIGICMFVTSILFIIIDRRKRKFNTK
ncbi:SdrD B-like domain-containing protein [Clostridium ganghwense]|uniref:Carboxypeptidase regulatory-like domain-containing protein n=1 Tax=Clostridium ganghwense TaxID=312089 RepID=A0ABT4CKK8_9CLOT|nr:SdrD B-like domain-containing protein [Clostridium ganghwense]MCY6369577.1 carboxypeptidase regulatory-like domain-containing protein [Clostridium ganghwense]